jgi:Flp pilus assembly protein TadD
MAHGNLGAVLFNRRRYQAAEEEYRKAIELSPTLAFFYVDMSIVLKRQSKDDEAQAAMQRALALLEARIGSVTSPDREALINDTEVASRYEQYGLAIISAGKHKDAADAFGRAVAAAPNNADYHSLRADALRRFGRVREADEEQRLAKRLREKQ